MTSGDERFMARALELAALPPFVSPNPRVGAVVVTDGAIVAEGTHHGAGTSHAEIAALGAGAPGGTLYVTLEPCTHHGRTPPCAPLVAASGVARVVIAMEDPDARVRGAGIAHLRRRGIDVTVGVLERRARRLNSAYVHQRSTGRPLVTLKLALSIDGRLAAADGSARWITGPESRRRVHRRRLEADAVLVGAGTVLADDPELTVRDVDAPRQPVRVIVDSTGRVPASARVFSAEAPTIVATTEGGAGNAAAAWRDAGAEVLVLPGGEGGVALAALVDRLAQRDWVEIWCEGGGRLAGSLLRQRLVGRLEVHYGPVLLGGGPQVGDVGVATLAGAPRWRLVEAFASGDDFVAILENEG